MQLHWSDQGHIAQALLKTYPDQDRLKLSLDDLHKMIISLPNFSQAGLAPTKPLLEKILWDWMRLADSPEMGIGT